MSTSWPKAVRTWRAARKHRSAEWQRVEGWALERLARHLGEVSIARINTGRVEDLRAALLEEGLSPKTVNHHLGIVGAVMRHAYERDQVKHVPRIRFLRIPLRLRYLRQDQAQRLLGELAPHVQDMAAFTLETGLRRGNVCRLKWEHVDLERRFVCIPAPMSKNRRPIPVPLSREATRILKRLQRKNGSEFVFTYNGRPLNRSLSKNWYAALKRAEISDFTWHDLRHTWASWHAQAGTPLMVLQELGGWADVQMVRRYAHLNIEHLRPWVERRPAWRKTKKLH